MAEIVRFAREHGKRVAPQRTGHNAAPLGDLADTRARARRTTFDEVADRRGARRARVGGGAQWQDLVPQASEMGLAALHGSAPDIGIAGYTLGGGMGWYARKHGLAANSVTAIELVTGEGELRAGRSGQRAGAVLGAARRRRELRRGHRARVRPLPDRSGLRGGPVLPVRARHGGAARLARVALGRARGGDLGRPGPAGAADRRGPRFPSRPVVRGGRGGLPDGRGGGDRSS